MRSAESLEGFSCDFLLLIVTLTKSSYLQMPYA